MTDIEARLESLRAASIPAGPSSVEIHARADTRRRRARRRGRAFVALPAVAAAAVAAIWIGVARDHTDVSSTNIRSGGTSAVHSTTATTTIDTTVVPRIGGRLSIGRDAVPAAMHLLHEVPVNTNMVETVAAYFAVDDTTPAPTSGPTIRLVANRNPGLGSALVAHHVAHATLERVNDLTAYLGPRLPPPSGQVADLRNPTYSLEWAINANTVLSLESHGIKLRQMLRIAASAQFAAHPRHATDGVVTGVLEMVGGPAIPGHSTSIEPIPGTIEVVRVRGAQHGPIYAHPDDQGRFEVVVPDPVRQNYVIIGRSPMYFGPRGVCHSDPFLLVAGAVQHVVVVCQRR